MERSCGAFSVRSRSRSSRNRTRSLGAPGDEPATLLIEPCVTTHRKRDLIVTCRFSVLPRSGRDSVGLLATATSSSRVRPPTRSSQPRTRSLSGPSLLSAPATCLRASTSTSSRRRATSTRPTVR
ncbi:MAG: hypothetical protein [Circular genetic element sp.]|nr:MAG: hypothetical protein [Circular genetic element sp.]AXQ65299.1 MAG: hypothetical protein [Circular genetic element sp.]